MFTKDSFQHYKTGVTELDDAHWHLFDMIGKLGKLSVATEVAQLASDIMAAWLSHNELEEILMDQLAYPYQKGHKENHVAMYAVLSEKFLRIKDGYCNIKWISQDIETIMRDHNDHVDRQLGEFLTNKLPQVAEILDTRTAIS